MKPSDPTNAELSAQSADPVDRAFELLREESYRSVPDANLEAKLRRQYRPQRALAWQRRLPVLLALLGLSGAAVAGGAQWIRSWWFEVQVDGQTVSGTIKQGNLRTIPFETADGVRGDVMVMRDLDEFGAQRTSLEIKSSGEGVYDEQYYREVEGSGHQDRLPISELNDAVMIFSGVDADQGAFAFFAISCDGVGSRILVHHPSLTELPVLEVARLPFDILAAGAHAQFTELGHGKLSLTMSDGKGGVIEFSWRSSLAGAGERPAELESKDGSVGVSLGDELQRSRSHDH